MKQELFNFIHKLSNWKKDKLNPKIPLNHHFVEKITANYEKYQQNLQKGLSHDDAVKYLPYSNNYINAIFFQFPNNITEQNIDKLPIVDYEKVKVLNHIESNWYMENNLIFDIHSSFNDFYQRVMNKLYNNQYHKEKLSSSVKWLLKNQNIFGFIIIILTMIQLMVALFLSVCLPPLILSLFFTNLNVFIVCLSASLTWLLFFFLFEWLNMSLKYLFSFITILDLKDFSKQKIVQTLDFYSLFVYTDIGYKKDIFWGGLIAYNLLHQHNYHPYVMKAISESINKQVESIKNDLKSSPNDKAKIFKYNYDFLQQNVISINLKPYQQIINEINIIWNKHHNLKFEKLDLSQYNMETNTNELKNVLIQYKEKLIQTIMV